MNERASSRSAVCQSFLAQCSLPPRTCIFLGSIIFLGTAEWLRPMGAQQTQVNA